MVLVSFAKDSNRQRDKSKTGNNTIQQSYIDLHIREIGTRPRESFTFAFGNQYQEWNLEIGSLFYLKNYIYDYKFRDYLLSIGCDKEHSNEAINYLLNSFDGSLDLEELKVFYNLYTSASLNFKPEMHLSKLLNCSLLPGKLAKGTFS